MPKSNLLFCVLVYSVNNLWEGSTDFATIQCFGVFFKEFCCRPRKHHMFGNGFAFCLEIYRICHQLFLKINMISVKFAESQLETLSYY